MSTLFSPVALIFPLLLTLTAFTPPAHATNRLTASDFTYLGAFRLPGDETRPQTFAYGGNAMTFNPDGDPGNADAYPGSLFVMGHDRIPYGDLPNGNQVAEISIPEPVISRNLIDLPQAGFLQNFQEVVADYFHDMDEIPKVGMAYLNHPATGPKIHLTWGQHLQPENAASQGWFNPTLNNPDFQGIWFIGDQNLYSVNGYLFEIPAAWADAYAQGRYLATGRMRDGGQGGMGPALFAYRPWLSDGSAPPSGTRLAETPLLLYENAYNTDQIVRAMNGYQHPDEWEGGAWISTTSGQSAVLFAGTKSNGAKYWYGYINARGSEYPCVDQHVTDFVTCRLANGAACPAEDFAGCCDEAQGDCASYRGWWSTRFDAQFILYDPADLARVAAGELESWQPQPYAAVDIDQYLYLNPPVWDELTVGTGHQRRYRVGDVAYDRAHNLLYVLEQLADGGKPVVHVWQVGNGGAVASSLITHYYQAILGRAPEASGLSYWLGEIARTQGLGIDIQEAFRVMAGQFFTSDEYLNQNASDAQYVTDLYETFFNRAPDSGGLSYWTDQLTAGLPRSVVLFHFLFSDEFAATMQGLFGDTASRSEISAIVDFYRGFLNRSPDNDGFSYWLNRFRIAQCQGASAVTAEVERISAQFMASAEYTGRQRDHPDFVADLYYAFLRRGSEWAGFDYWVNQLNSHALSRDATRQAFVQTPEFQNRVNQIINEGCVAPVVKLTER